MKVAICMTQAPLDGCGGVVGAGAVVTRSWAMSASGLVMMRAGEVRSRRGEAAGGHAGAEDQPGVVVVTVPLLAVVLVPEAEVPTSKGLVVARPLYSVARMST